MPEDNSVAQVDNNLALDVSPEAEAGIIVDAPEPTPSPAPAPAPKVVGWKSTLRTDLKDSPLLQKFEDTPDGLNKALESHANLEKLLGHEKVPIPKDANDKEGWARFGKAMGIPDKPSDYKLTEIKLPETMKGLALDKAKFTEVIHANKLTPAAADGLWKAYNEINIGAYNKALQDHQNLINQNVNALRQEWGDAYQSNVELGQTVINKFSQDQETNDFLTTAFASDPRGIKFLAKIGEQFAENKVGEFQIGRFTKAPDQAQAEIDKIIKDRNHPYSNPKASDREHDAAVAYVNSLYAVVSRAKG